jgi:spectinomycin phosphotransferase
MHTEGVRAPPEHFDERKLLAALAGHWGLHPEAMEYLTVGAGGYHWVVRDTTTTHQRHFLTVDDLDQKNFLGEKRTAAFTGLHAALRTAGALRDRAGLEFVVAPIATNAGEPVVRIDERYAVAVYPYLEARPCRGWKFEAASERADAIRVLVAMHAATPVVQSVALSRGLGVPGRRGLEAAMREVDRPWSGGPFAEPAREQFVLHAAGLTRQLGAFDDLTRTVRAANHAPVITHGEPKANNFIRTPDDRLLLIDWDTVAVSLPERDLWMVATDTGEELALYTAATGRAVDPVALELYRLRWDLADLAAYTSVCRSEHLLNADSEHAFASVRLLLSAL